LHMAIFALAFQVVQGGAAVYTLSDVNSQVFIDPQTQAGMHNWIVDNQPVAMQKQWFWYRVGPGGPETSVDVLPFVGPILTDRNPFTDPSLDTFAIKYQGAQFDIEFTASLQGGVTNSGRADITEQIKISNTTGYPLEFHFFEYADFDLGQLFVANKAVPLPDDDLVLIKLDQVTGLPTEVVQWDASMRVTETIITPDASLAEAAFFSFTLVKLNNAVADNLNNVLVAGPGDVTWAFQWDFMIDPYGSVQISKDKSVVPEPPAWSLVALGLFGYGVLRRWVNRRK